MSSLAGPSSLAGSSQYNSPGDLGPSTLPVNRLPGPGGRLYYQIHMPMGLPIAQFRQEHFLPAIWEAMQPVPPLSERLDGAWKASTRPVMNVDAILDMLACCLKPRAMQYWNQAYCTNLDLYPPRTAFVEPLLSNHEPPRVECMVIDGPRLQQNRHLLQGRSGSGYVRVKLFEQDGRTVFVSAHRLVLWAVHGMPVDASHKVVMHYPCNNSWCLSIVQRGSPGPPIWHKEIHIRRYRWPAGPTTW